MRFDNLPERPTGTEALKVVKLGTAGEGEEGIVVLWDSVTYVWPCCGATEVWNAVDQTELVELWKRVGWQKPTPRVDFERNAVFALLTDGNACPGDVVGVDVEPGGVLRVLGESESNECFDNLQARAQIIAVPRRFVRRRTTVLFYEYGGATVFEISSAPE